MSDRCNESQCEASQERQGLMPFLTVSGDPEDEPKCDFLTRVRRVMREQAGGDCWEAECGAERILALTGYGRGFSL